jgi:hypothetical protein
MTSGTKSKKPARATVASELSAAITTAVENWRRWAHEIASGGRSPAAHEILEAAAILGISDPGPALDADAAASAAYTAAEARVELQRKKWRDELEAHGGPAGVKEKLEQLRAEVRALERINSPGVAMALGATMGEATGIRNRNPRMFSATYQGEKR